MKKAFLLLLMSLFSLVLFAQTEHMKFAGIPLTGSIEQFQKKLIAKGFRLNAKISKLLPVGTRSFIGTFAGKKGISLFTMTQIRRPYMEPRFTMMACLMIGQKKKWTIFDLFFLRNTEKIISLMVWTSLTEARSQSILALVLSIAIC